jgi:small subunit ribosomal protein S16
VNINFDRALYWLEVGAAPSDTARSILKREGVYMMKHLRGGVAKGAFSENEAQRKFEAWKQEKNSKLKDIENAEREAKRKAVKERLAAETKVKEAISAKVAAKAAEAAAAQAKAAQEAAEAAAAEAAAEAAEEAPAAEAEQAAE